MISAELIYRKYAKGRMQVIQYEDVGINKYLVVILSLQTGTGFCKCNQECS
jgi:hypothetical protein